MIAYLKKSFDFNLGKQLRNELYRKAVHLSSLWMPALIYFTDTEISFLIFTSLFIIDLVIEYCSYKKLYWARKTYKGMFIKALRLKEIKKDKFQASGSLYVLFAAALCSLIFPKAIAAAALSIMLISDTCAAIFGKAFGTRKLLKAKFLEGTTAFFVSSLLVMLFYAPILPVTHTSILACIAATFAELYESRIKLDDNFSIPLSVGIILMYL